MDYLGDERLLKGDKAVILNSRQTKKPTGDHPWVQNTYRAVQHAVENGNVILSSAGMNTWEFVVWATGNLGGSQIIIIPIDIKDDPREIRDDLIKDFNLDRERTAIMYIRTRRRGLRNKSAWAERDTIAVETANTIYPVSVRKNGNLERLFKNNPNKASRALMDFNIDYNPVTVPERIQLEARDLHPEIRNHEWPYLTHYTRSTYNPWPGESSADYYRAIFESEGDYPRSALATLKRIIADKKIWASYYHIRGGYKVVSLTELKPHEAVSIIRWRPRFVRWNFEPYGIAIDKEFARSIGIRPVIYKPSKEFDSLPEEDKPYYQNPGDKGGEWEPEREWRHLGNIDLSGIPEDKIHILVRNECEIFDCPYPVSCLSELG